MNPDGMVALLDYREDGVTPYMIFFKDGLEMEKCLAVTLDQSPVVKTGWPLLFIHTTPGLRQMGLMSSRALHLF